MTVRRRRLRPGRLWIALVAALVVCSGCTTPPTERESMERIVNLGYESVVTAEDDLSQLQARLNEVGANSVNISVGRLDWTAFRWDEYPESASAEVQESGRDYPAEAISALGVDADGNERRIGLTIDLLVPAWIEEDPGVAAVQLDGERSVDFASVSALTDGSVGDRLDELVAELAQRYSPDVIVLTELMFDANSFGGDDLESYRTATGREDWPRLPDGGIDVSDPGIGQWRSERIAGLVSRVTETANNQGVDLEMDVRASWENPDGDRAESGHDYELLLDAADRIAIWNYFALNDREPAYSRELAESLSERAGDRFVMSVGLWASEGVVSPEEMSEAVEQSIAGGATAVSVTPASMMTDEHWERLQESW